MRTVLLPVFALTTSSAVYAQMVDAHGKSIDAFQVDEAPIIDGQLDDDAWEFATVVDNLHQVA